MMGSRGPAPKPTQLKKLAGNPGKRALNQNEPEPDVFDEIPEPPSWIVYEAKKEWYRLAPHLMRLGLLTALDTTALTMYCRTFQRWVEAEQEIKTSGAVWTSEETGYTQQTAWVSIANAEFQKLRQMLSEFGMTPSSRSKISLPEKEKKVDPFESFLSSETVARKKKAS